MAADGPPAGGPALGAPSLTDELGGKDAPSLGAPSLADELAGNDALALGDATGPGHVARAWSTVWPKLAAVGLALVAWQIVVWGHWKPDYVLPGPGPVLRRLGGDLGTSELWRAIGTTMRRALTGYLLAAVVGTALGVGVARSQTLRSAVGSLITGLQTMPSIAWFPLAIVLFRLSEPAILFVIVIGAAPSIANGVVGGVDHVPPLLLRGGRMLGAHGLGLWRHVVLPAALPSLVGGLKQGWAFAWRSLMAGELVVPGHPSLGAGLDYDRSSSDYVGLLELMIVILVIGLLVDTVFAAADDHLRRGRGLIEARG